MAGQAGSPSTTCWRACPRARSASFSYFVTRIASGRVERGLPLALRRCGYDTLSLYPAFGAFMSARSFQTTTGIQHFSDAHDLHAKDVEPDSFFYDKAAGPDGRAEGVRHAAVHLRLSRRQSFPVGDEIPSRPAAGVEAAGQRPAIDEYLRRQTMSANDYAGFVAALKKKFPAQPFLIVRYGDHQPEFSPQLLDPSSTRPASARS